MVHSLPPRTGNRQGVRHAVLSGFHPCFQRFCGQAATPAAWKALDTAAQADCSHEIVRLASKAKVAGISGRVSGIGAVNDGDRYYALILQGKTAGFKSQWLCLYDKRAKQATAREVH